MTLAEKRQQIQARLDLYLAAEETILNGGQSYAIGNRSLDRGDLKEIRNTIRMLNTALANNERGGTMRVQQTIPWDT